MAFYNKRKSDSSLDHRGYVKKSRIGNGQQSHNIEQSSALPPLPSITTDLEKSVFTHTSVAVQHPDNPKMVNYERLEFLGDAQLEHIASLVIFERYTSAAPGKMSTLREALVKNETISQYSYRYGFDKRLKISFTLESSKERNKILGDVFEAYVAAVIASDHNQSRGFETARQWLTQLWEPVLVSLKMKDPNVDSKQNLAKKVLWKGIRLNYLEERPAIIKKAIGDQLFFMGVYLTGWGYDNQHLGSGEGASKKAAEQAAAHSALNNNFLLDDIIAKRTKCLEEVKRMDDQQETDNTVPIKQELQDQKEGNSTVRLKQEVQDQKEANSTVQVKKESQGQ